MACDGIWVDAEVFESLCADKEAQAAVIHRFAQSAVAAPSAFGTGHARAAAR